MSGSEYTNPNTGYIDGYAMRSKEVEDKHRAAWEYVKDLPRSEYIASKTAMYGRNIIVLTSEAAGLSPLQKLVLADGGPCPFGGVVNGLRVEVYND